jgi:hypothetical protein
MGIGASGFMSRSDIANFYASQAGLTSALMPCVVRAGNGNRSAWASFLRPGAGSATSQVTPFRCLVSFRDIEATKSGKDLLLDLSCFAEWSSIMIALGRLDMSVIVMARFAAIEEICGEDGRFVLRMEALGSPPINFNFGSMNMYGVISSAELEPSPAGGINELIESPGIKLIQQLMRLHRSIAGSIKWVDFLWLFVLSTPLICGVSIGGRSVLSEGGRPMSWLAKLGDGSSWIASYWLSIGPEIKQHLIDTGLILALDGKVAQAVLSISESIDVADRLSDDAVIEALTPGRGVCTKVPIYRLIDVSPTLPPLDISVGILQVFLYHAVSLESAIPTGERANRISDIGFPSADDLGCRGEDVSRLSARLEEYPLHVESNQWGSPAIMASLSAPSRAIGGSVPVIMKAGVGVVVAPASASSSSIASTWSPASLSASQQRDQQDQAASLHLATIAASQS